MHPVKEIDNHKDHEQNNTVPEQQNNTTNKESEHSIEDKNAQDSTPTARAPGRLKRVFSQSISSGISTTTRTISSTTKIPLKSIPKIEEPPSSMATTAVDSVQKSKEKRRPFSFGRSLSTKTFPSHQVPRLPIEELTPPFQVNNTVIYNFLMQLPEGYTDAVLVETLTKMASNERVMLEQSCSRFFQKIEKALSHPNTNVNMNDSSSHCSHLVTSNSTTSSSVPCPSPSSSRNSLSSTHSPPFILSDDTTSSSTPYLSHSNSVSSLSSAHSHLLTTSDSTTSYPVFYLSPSGSVNNLPSTDFPLLTTSDSTTSSSAPYLLLSNSINNLSFTHSQPLTTSDSTTSSVPYLSSSNSVNSLSTNSRPPTPTSMDSTTSYPISRTSSSVANSPVATSISKKDTFLLGKLGDIKKMHDVIHEIQESQMNETFITTLLDINSNISLWNGCLLCNGYIIDSKILFSLLKNKIHCSISGEPSDLTLRALLFGHLWLKKNKNCSLIEDVKQEVQEIIELLSENTSEVAKKFHAEFTQHLEEETKVGPECISIESEKPTEEFTTILSELSTKNLIGSAKTIANDLHRRQIIMYNDLQSNHFIEKKWLTKPFEIECIVSFQNTVTNYMLSTIIHSEKYSTSILLTEFFLELCEAALQNHDFATLFALAPLFYSSTLKGLKILHGQVFKKLRYKEIREKILKIVSPTENYRILRQEMDSCKDSGTPYIPFIGVYLGDIQKTSELSAICRKSNRHEPEYNIEKLTGIYTAAMSAVTANKINLNQTKYETDFIIKILAEYTLVDEDELIEQVKQKESIAEKKRAQKK